MRLFPLKGSVPSTTEFSRGKTPAVEAGDTPSARANPPSADSPADAGSTPVSGSPERKIGWRVIFIGSTADWFRVIKREIVALQPNWGCHHAPGVAEAESALETGAFDGMVVDERVAEVGELLSRVEQKRGRMICLVRCDVSDRTTVTQWNRSGMTPVSLDADAVALVACLKRLECLRNWMADPAIKKLLPLIRKLPAEPRLHAQVTEQLQSPNSSIHSVALLISQDPVMSAKILQVVNSAFFGLTQQVTDTAEAVMVLGTERIRSLILLAGVFSRYGDAECPGFSAEPICGHSLQVAMFARTITFGETKDAKMAETAFTAGLLHDIGKLLLAGNVPEVYDTIRRTQASKRISQREAESIVLGTTHAELGACLLATWGMPLPLLEAIAWHHEPGKSSEQGFSLLAAVHAANVFAHENDQGDGEGQDTISLDFLMRMGLGDCRNRWREFCGLTAQQESGTPEERLVQCREAKQN